MKGRLLALALVATVAHGNEAHDRAKEAFLKGMRRPPLGRRAYAIARFARSGHPQALPLLLARYKKTRSRHEKYIIAHHIGRRFRSAPSFPVLSKFMRRHRDNHHSWSHYRWFQGYAAAARLDEVEQWIVKSSAEYSRAATITALGSGPSLGLLHRVLGDDSSSGAQRALTVEAVAQAITNWRKSRKSPQVAKVVELLIQEMERKGTSERTRLIIARRLAYLYESKVALDSNHWRRLASFEQIESQTGSTRTYRPTFGGIEGTGSRVVFLIDLSDSMRQIMPDGTRSRLQWAKTMLAESVEALDKDTWFAVVAFGDEARPLKSTRGLVRATKPNKRSVLRELQDIVQGRGDTNLHGAFRLAFRMTRRKLSKPPAFIDPRQQKHGVDTIFVLSDGDPTADDFEADDFFEGGAYTKNAEKGEIGKDGAPGTYSFFGPYVGANALAVDVERMNLFQRAEINCIAIGEANDGLLRRLAAEGLGKFRRATKKAKRDSKKSK